jgi:hypothetical protein
MPHAVTQLMGLPDEFGSAERTKHRSLSLKILPASVNTQQLRGIIRTKLHARKTQGQNQD